MVRSMLKLLLDEDVKTLRVTSTNLMASSLGGSWLATTSHEMGLALLPATKSVSKKADHILK